MEFDSIMKKQLLMLIFYLIQRKFKAVALAAVGLFSD